MELNLPGVDPELIDLDIERNVLTVKAERRPTMGENAEVVVAERPSGSFSRQLFLSETLDTERVDASYEAGVLRLTTPVAEQAKPRKIAVSGGEGASGSAADLPAGPVGARGVPRLRATVPLVGGALFSTQA